MKEVSIGQKVWIMLQNRPAEIIISKIVTTQELIINRENPLQKIVIFGSNGAALLHEFSINNDELYSSKAELMEAVFNP